MSTTTSTNSHFFRDDEQATERIPVRDAGQARAVRIVHGDKLLEEKLGRNDLCPCGSGKRFKKCCLQIRLLLMGSIGTTTFRER